MNKTPDVDAVPNFQLDPPEISDEFFQTQTENLPEKDDTLRRLDDQNLDLSDQDYLLKNESKKTKASTKYAVKTFNSVMESIAQKNPDGNWPPLEKVSDEDLPKKNRFTGGPDSRLFTFFSRLAQAEKRTKTKAVWSSCKSILFGSSPCSGKVFESRCF